MPRRSSTRALPTRGSSASTATRRRWQRAREALAGYGDRVRLVHADFREIPAQLGGERADGILLDLGVSSVQLDTAERGFSFQADGPLDMRMDRSAGETAADVVNEMDEEDLADVIYRFGEDRASRKIARAIVSARRQQRIETTGELAAIVRRASGRPSWKPGIDSATRTFQALRIHVNRELDRLSDDACARSPPASPPAAGWPSSPSTAWRTARSSTPSAPSAPKGSRC